MEGANATTKLWKKESSHPGALYVDYFSASLEKDFRKFVVNHLSDAQKNQVKKNDDVSIRLQKLGAREFFFVFDFVWFLIFY